MSPDILYEEDGTTPLNNDELQGLKLDWVTTRGELNSAERTNIEKAEEWIRKQRTLKILDAPFLKRLHKTMFGEVWKWAGTFRTSEKNIGVETWRIGTELRQLLDDVSYWIENHTYPPDEIAARFHHRLVKIHPFPNGNGRHARLATNLLLTRLNRDVFSWGANCREPIAEIRARYIAALRAADGENYAPLFAFVRS